MQFFTKKVIAGLILASFATVIFFSIPFMMHGPSSQMGSDCLFPSSGVALCPQTGFGSAIHHLSAYQSFLNVTANPGVQGLIALIVFLTLIALALIVFWASPPLLKVVVRSNSSKFAPVIPLKIEETAWLSLFENSPSRV